MNPKRQFTPAEDALIIANSKGQLSLWQLEKRLHSKQATIRRRADELGVKIFARTGKRWKTEKTYHIHGEDRLLARLMAIHGNA